jgi:hypothetical protein
MWKILNYVFATFIYSGLILALYGNKPLIAVSSGDVTPPPSSDPSQAESQSRGVTASVDRLAISI